MAMSISGSAESISAAAISSAAICSRTNRSYGLSSLNERRRSPVLLPRSPARSHSLQTPRRSAYTHDIDPKLGHPLLNSAGVARSRSTTSVHAVSIGAADPRRTSRPPRAGKPREIERHPPDQRSPVRRRGEPRVRLVSARASRASTGCPCARPPSEIDRAGFPDWSIGLQSLGACTAGSSSPPTARRRSRPSRRLRRSTRPDGPHASAARSVHPATALRPRSRSRSQPSCSFVQPLGLFRGIGDHDSWSRPGRQIQRALVGRPAMTRERRCRRRRPERPVFEGRVPFGSARCPRHDKEEAFLPERSERRLNTASAALSAARGGPAASTRTNKRRGNATSSGGSGNGKEAAVDRCGPEQRTVYRPPCRWTPLDDSKRVLAGTTLLAQTQRATAAGVKGPPLPPEASFHEDRGQQRATDLWKRC